MFMRKFNFNLEFKITFLFAACWLAGRSSYAIAQESTASDYTSAYAKVIETSDKHFDRDHAIELIVSGTAATIVGVYGYYFDERGNLARLAYTGTQTAGVIVIGEGIRRFYGESQIATINALLQKGDITRSELERVVVENDKRQQRAKRIADAWTAGLLGSLYAYNAVRTPKSLSIAKNSFMFLSVNALALSGYNSYLIYRDSENLSAVTFEARWDGIGIVARF